MSTQGPTQPDLADAAMDRVYHTNDLVNALFASVRDYGKACADDLPESQERWLEEIGERIEKIQQDAYAEGRKDEREQVLAQIHAAQETFQAAIRDAE